MHKLVLTPSRFTPLVVQRQKPDGLTVSPPRLLRSPIPYPGSKSKVVKQIAKAMPTDWMEFREPFAGGLSLSLHLMQRYPGRRFWINDLDPFLSSFWVALASEPDQLVKTLNYYLAEFPSNADKLFLVEWARGLVHGTQGVERAALYYLMAKTSFTGMAFSGPATKPRQFTARTIEQLKAVGHFLKSVDLRVTDLDYADCLTDDPEVFTYFDPPYLIDRHIYGEDGNMHRNFDHRRFAKAVNSLKSRWMVSYNDDPLIRRYFKSHRISTLKVPYTMATKIRATELLITNYEN